MRTTMHAPLRAASLISAILGAGLCTQPAQAEVRHCVTADGQSVFTDRECHRIGATEQAPRTPGGPARVVQPATCARSVQELAFEITMAIDAQDTNRLANVFHWAGMSSREAFAAWQRLDTIAKRPLADIVPVEPQLPSAPPVPASQASPAPAKPSWTTEPATPPMPQPPPAAAMVRTPVALRLEQTVDGTAHPASTTLALVRHFDCWWVRF